MHEKVFTVTDYYDGPIKGVAEYNGLPHVFELRWDEKLDDWSEYFLLKPIDKETLQLVLEDWDIWRRWEQAFHSGETTRETHPALPEDKKRDDELEIILEPLLKIDPATAKKAKASFEPLSTPKVGIKDLVVTWVTI